MSEWTSGRQLVHARAFVTAPLVAVVAEGSFSDPQNARIIYLAAAGLVVVAVLLAVGTVIWWRGARAEHPVLGPLEVMGTRRWWKGDFHDRKRRLDVVRVSGGDLGPEAAHVPVDLDAVMEVEPVGFEDLTDEGAAAGAAAVPILPPPAASPRMVSLPVPADPTSAQAAHDLDVDVDDDTAGTVAPIDPLLRLNQE